MDGDYYQNRGPGSELRMTDAPKPAPPHKPKRWGMFLLRWTIAIVGIGWVVMKTPLYDSVTMVNPADGRPMKVRLAEDVPDKVPATVKIINPTSGKTEEIPRSELINGPDTKWVLVREPWGVKKKRLLGLDLSDDLKTVRQFLVENDGGKGQWVTPDRVSNYTLSVPYPLVDQGIVPMVRNANHRYLLCAVGIFWITFLITGIRWNLLMRAVDIRIGAVRAMIINMVGAFWNTLLLGSAGGDVVKAYYAAKLAPGHRTRAVTSVVVDRAIGLLALIILGGEMAANIALTSHTPNDPVAQSCAQIAIAALLICVGTVVGLFVIYQPRLRKLTGFDYLLGKLPEQVRIRADKALHTLELYRQRPWTVLAALLMSFPVHITVVVSAMFSGMALGLPLTPAYYFVVVPVVVLAGAIPISPQGAGVMEFFAILLTKQQGCKVGHAFALTMSIRLVQIFWNMWGGIFVIKGGYHAPTEGEQASVENDDSEEERVSGVGARV